MVPARPSAIAAVLLWAALPGGTACAAPHACPGGAELLSTELADGFDFPFGDPEGKGSYVAGGKRFEGWYVAAGFAESYELGIHTGEDWNGRGGGDTDLGQPVYASGAGIVIHAGDAGAPFGNVVAIEHRYLDHDGLRTVVTQYDHLQEVEVEAGTRVARRRRIGTIGKGSGGVYPAHLHFEIRRELMAGEPVDYWPSSHGKTAAWVREHYEPPSEFVGAHRTLPVPARAPLVLLVSKRCHHLSIYGAGRLERRLEVAISQEPSGPKRREGDLRLPEGLYRICQKAAGPFPAEPWQNAYLGSRWMRISYPNPADAARGRDEGAIGAEELRQIVAAASAGTTPPQRSALGGGIGIHGWRSPDWPDAGPRDLTWGCVSVHAMDLERLYDRTPIGTPIVIVP